MAFNYHEVKYVLEDNIYLKIFISKLQQEIASVPPMRKLSKQEREVLVEGYLRKKPGKTDSRIARSLHYSTAEGAVTSVSNSVTNSYTTPFALALGATNSQIGLLSSVKSLAETLAQVPGALLTQHISRKSIWVFSWLSSRAFWMPVVLLPFLALWNAVYVLIFLLGVITFLASLNGPAWASLMGDIVPDDVRGRYFGRRNMIAGLSGLAATIAAGAFISTLGFPLIFSIALIVGLTGTLFFIKMYEPPSGAVYHYRHSFSIRPKDIAASVRVNRSFAVFTLFIAAMNFAVHIASPFFAVYMLRDLGISYGAFGALVAFEALVAIVCQPYWGKLADRYGERLIITVTGILACFVPLVWLFVSSPLHIVFANAFSAFTWAGFDLAAFNFVIAAVPSDKRPQYISNHRLVKGIALVCGALLGGVLAEKFGAAAFLGFTGLQAVFLVSFLLRLASLPALAAVKEADMREHELVPVKYVFWRAVAVEPAQGLKHAAEYTFHYPYEFAKLKAKIEKKLNKI